MKTWGSILLGSVGILSLTATSFAADLPSRAVSPITPSLTQYNWSGFYIGVNAGVNVPFNNNFDLYWVSPPTDFASKKKSDLGFLGGAQIGGNYQFGNWVLGLEADIDYVNSSRRLDDYGMVLGSVQTVSTPTTNTTTGSSYTPPSSAGAAPITLNAQSISNSGTFISSNLSINGVSYGAGVLHGKTFYPANGSDPYDLTSVNGPSDLTATTTTTTSTTTITTPPTTLSTSLHVKQSYVGTARTRFGYAWDRAFIYGTAGLAYGEVDIKGSATQSTGAVFTASKSTTKVGWALGAGVEYAITNNISLKGEYIYYDLGKAKASMYDGATFVGQAKTSITGSIFRAGLNFKFN